MQGNFIKILPCFAVRETQRNHKFPHKLPHKLCIASKWKAIIYVKLLRCRIQKELLCRKFSFCYHSFSGLGSETFDCANWGELLTTEKAFSGKLSLFVSTQIWVLRWDSIRSLFPLHQRAVS
jgi:hypothetical protein